MTSYPFVVTAWPRTICSLIATSCALLCNLSQVRAADTSAAQPSAFIRSYAGSGVQWMSWGEPAFERAKNEQKPVLLVVGTFTSELSRAMHRQTFSNQDTAAFLNENFVCILVDAKEDRRLTALYQQYLQTVKQLSGLPMNLWLTPELKPFEGANYLPPTEEWGKEGFLTVAKRAAAGWKADPDAQRAKADEAVTAVKEAQAPFPAAPIEDSGLKQLLTEATEAWRARFDPANGGFGDPSKYPEPELLRFLLGDVGTQEMALTTLRKMIDGAIHDPLDGGFFRYSVDAEWRQPYFQKVMSDQARIALALLEATAKTGDEQFASAARDALRYVTTHLRLPNGDFAAAEDGTPETITPSYLWTLSEVTEALGESSAKQFSSAYGVSAEGNIPPDSFPGITTTGKNLLYRVTPASDPQLEETLAQSAAKLLAIRQKRTAPLRDDGSTCGMHGLLLEALSKASLATKDAELSQAVKDEFASFQKDFVLQDGSLRRLLGRSDAAAPEDYVFAINGLMAYSASSRDRSAEALAKSLLNTLTTRFWSEEAGRFYVVEAEANKTLWARTFSPSPGPSDLPSIEASLLTTLQSTPIESANVPNLIAKLRATVANDITQSAEAARGELLLSLAAIGAGR